MTQEIQRNKQYLIINPNRDSWSATIKHKRDQTKNRGNQGLKYSKLMREIMNKQGAN